MRLSAGLKFIVFGFLALIIPTAHAEYYLQCRSVIPNVTVINCKGHHCSYKTHHAMKYAAEPRSRHRHIERHCDLDRATGDDNPCEYPDMQIN